MISFIKFLKVVLPIISVTTATLTTVSLISHKKHDPDAQAKPEEINLDNFVTLSEDFKESIMLYSKDGTGENVTIEDEEKAKKLLEHLKENGSLETFPEFETPEQAAEFLDQLPKAILNDLLKDSKFSQDELKNLDPNTLNNLGRFGEDLRSQQQQQQQQQQQHNDDIGWLMPSQENLPSVAVEGVPNMPKINGLDGNNLKSMEETTQKALDASKALQNSDLTRDLEDLGKNSTLQDVSNKVTDSLSSSMPSVSVSTPKMPTLQAPDVSIKFEGPEGKEEGDSTKEHGGSESTEDNNSFPEGGQDNEVKDGQTESSDGVVDSEQQDLGTSNNLRLDEDDSSIQDIPTSLGEISPDIPQEKSSESLPPEQGEPSVKSEAGQSRDSREGIDPFDSQNDVDPVQSDASRDRMDLTVPQLPDLNLPDMPFDFNALNGVFDALSKLGGEGADGISVVELKEWADKLAKTSNSLGNLISRS